MTTAFRFANVSGRVHHALSAREARANPLTSSGLKSAHRTRTLKPDGAFPDTQSIEGCCAGRRAQVQPSTASAFKIVPIAYRRRSGQQLGGWRTQSRRIRWQSRWQSRARCARFLSMPAAARVGRLFVVERQLLTSLKVSNFDQTATKECMILHVRPRERLPPTPRHPRRPVKRA